MSETSQQGATQALSLEMGLSEGNIERRKKLVGLEAADIARIATLKDLIAARVDEFVDAFFRHFAGIEEGRILTANRTLLERARHLKREHLLGLVSGNYDANYVAQRLELALVYARAGIDGRVFLAAFRRMFAAIGAAVIKRPGVDAAESFDCVTSLEKVGGFDVGLILDVLVAERERTIRQQQEAIRELSTPVLQIRDRMLLLPIIGVIDTHRARLITDQLLKTIRTTRAKVVVMDVTGVATIDSRVANHLLQTVTAARLMGALVMVTGITSEVAQSLVALGIELSKLNTAGDLQGGLEEAERLLGYEIRQNAAMAPSLTLGI